MHKKFSFLLFSVIFSLFFLLQPIPVARGDLQSSLNKMFNGWGGASNVTAPGAYNAQTRGFLVGGRISARVPESYIHPFTFKEPSLTAGCGGLDIFGGSFSFINAQQLIATLKQVGMNAAGYAFQLGLEAVAPTISDALKTMRKWMNDMNALGANTCQAAKALVNTGIDSVMDWQMQSCQTKNGINGSGGVDPVQGWLQCASSNGNTNQIVQNLRSSIYGDSYDTTRSALQGNTMGPIRGSTTLDLLRNIGLSNEQKQEIMSVVGTFSTSAQRDTVVCDYVAPSITFEQLVDGGDVHLLACGEGGYDDESDPPCEDVHRDDATTHIDGFTKLVTGRMTDILNQYKLGQALTDEQQVFVNSIPVPAVAYMLQRVSVFNDDLPAALIDMTAEAAAVSYAWSQIQYYIDQYEGHSSHVTICPANKDAFEKVVEKLKNDRYVAFQKYTQMINTQAQYLRIMSDIDTRLNADSSKKIKAALAFGK